MKLKNLIFLIAAVITISACDDRGIFANGNIISESRSVDSFNALNISVPASVYITQDAQQDLRIETHEDVMNVIETEVTNGVLNIRLSRSLRNLRTLNIYISAADYESLDMSGAVSIQSEGCLNLGNLEVRSSGASKVDICGQADALTLRLSGASEFKGYSMEAQSVRAVVSGATEVRITAEQLLDVTLSGASRIRYKGNPHIQSDVSGASSLVNAN